MEKRFARLPDNDNVSASGETIADKMVATEAFKDLQGGRVRGRAHVEMAAITSGNTTVGTGRSASTSLVAADRRPGIVTPAERVLTIRDLIAPGETSSNAIEYVQETGFANNAAPVAEGAQKPYYDLILPAVTLWERTTPTEAAQIEAAMEAQDPRSRNIFRAAQTFRSDPELWPLLEQLATQLFGEERAAELLAQ